MPPWKTIVKVALFVILTGAQMYCARKSAPKSES